MTYLFIGQDSLSKDAKLKSLRTEVFEPGTEQFNLDILYARELSLKNLQEKLLFLPANNSRRMLVIKEAEKLKDEIKEFLLRFAKSGQKQVILVLDADHLERKDEFFNLISKYSKPYYFKETRKVDSFTLSRSIALKKADQSLRILNQLLKEGERPERILGGLRYALERDSLAGMELRRRMRLLLNCDLEIKTGKIKPVLALEKLVVNLCCLGKPLH